MLILGLKVTGSLNSTSVSPLTGAEDSVLMGWLNPAISLVDGVRSNLMDQYVDGTRAWLFKEVEEWIDSENAERLLWLNASAGVGKSVMAALISEKLHRENLLGAAFFCRHDIQQLRTPLSLITTISYSLAKWSPAIGRYLIRLKDSETVVDFRSSTPVLFRQLVLDPLNEIAASCPLGTNLKPLVLVIDALDECGEQNARADMLKVFASQFKGLPSFVRILVTSRPEEDIVAAFEATNLPQRVIQPSDANNQRDARIVADSRIFDLGVFDQVERNYIVEALLQKSNGLFVWLVMALRSMDHGSVTLDKVQDLPGGLDSLYHTTFLKAFHRRTDPYLTAFIGTVCVAMEPLNPSQISAILRISEEHVVHFVVKLRGILNQDSGSGKISFLHKSVSDYLTNHGICQDERFSVNVGAKNADFATSTLKLLDGLYYNMGNLQSGIKFDGTLKTPFPDSLSYSAKYWPNHFALAQLSPSVMSSLSTFCETKLANWMECLLLLQQINCLATVPVQITSVIKSTYPSMPESYSLIFKLLDDVKRVAINFRDPLCYNPLQVYESAIAWAPRRSELHKRYHTSKSLQVSIGADQQWGPLTILGHQEGVRSLAHFPNNEFFVSASEDKTLKVWNIETGECVQTLGGHDGCVASVVVSKDSKIIVSGSWDGTVRVWELEVASGEWKVGQVLGVSSTSDVKVNSVVLSEDGALIWAGCSDGKLVAVQLCEESWDRKVSVDAHSDAVSSLALLNDGSVISGSWDFTLRVWKKGDDGIWFANQTLSGHKNRVTCLSVSRDGATLVSGSTDKRILVWKKEPKGGWRLLQALEGHGANIWAVDISTDSSRIVSTSDDSVSKTWTYVSGNQWVETGTTELDSSALYSVSLSPNSETAIVGCWDHSIKLLSLNHGSQSSSATSNSKVNAVAVSLDGKTVAVAYDLQIAIWNKGTQGWNSIGVLEGHEEEITCISVSTDGQLVVSGSFDNTAKVWNKEEEEWNLLHTLEGHESSLNCSSLSPNLESVFTGSFDNSIKVWSVDTGECNQTLQAGSDVVASLAASKGLLVSGSFDNTIRVWKLLAGFWECVQTLNGPSSGVFTVRLFEDCETIICGSWDESIKAWCLVANGDFSEADLDTENVSCLDAVELLDGQKLVANERMSSFVCREWVHDSKTFERKVWVPGNLRGNSASNAKTVVVWLGKRVALLE
ncbi:UNVERIFIED_CONTAM: hypothetical protein HDU68_007985 [Siphonaria sp. JEL0065]|nr:hypothetical protein HDU68_007985 [Siphonaria sp. JEL0065]